MNNLSIFGQRQQFLLKALLHNRMGLTVDELTRELLISRNAVNQHLVSLENGGYVENSSLSSTRGRPSKIYTLTDNGLELFPKHYALFSNLLIRLIKQRLGDEEFKDCLIDMGEQLAHEFKGRVGENNSLVKKISEVTEIMYELGYEAQVKVNPDNSSDIVASNCVFHKLAEEYSDVCELDLSLMSVLLDAKVEHKECMVKGGECCRFGISKE